MKIGIMTMHRVQNVGSVLQAYALQHKLEQLGHDTELIDYCFPPPKEKNFKVRDILGWSYNVLLGFPVEKKKNKLETFRKEFLHCSKETYYSRKELLANPPKYDIYCTGSDQVWNPRHVGEDTSFMLDFAPVDAQKFAYASSFAVENVDEPFFSMYAAHLKKYKNITVREKSGVNIVKQMTGKDATVVCDPTLLLSAEEWMPIAESSNLKMPDGYVLVYLLRYMFDPRPGFFAIVEQVRKVLGLPIYHYNPYTKDVLPHIKPLRGMGPTDFINLVRNAAFVITDSFHGAAFASIFNIPMIGVVKDNKQGDGRIQTLRAKVGGSHSVVCHNQQITIQANTIEKYRCVPQLVEDYRLSSTNELKRMIWQI